MNDIPSPDLPNRQAALASAVKDLYGTFKRYPLPEGLSRPDSSEHAILDKALLQAPLANLSAQALNHVAYHGLYTWRSLDDFKHFLPRILDLLTQGSFIHPEEFFHAFRWRDVHHWPNPEQRALETYLHAYCLRILAEYPCPLTDAEAALCAVASVLEDIHPLLIDWMHDPSHPSLLHLTTFLNKAAPRILLHKKLPNAFWSDTNHDQMRQIITWIKSPDLLRRIEKLFYLHCKDDLAQPLSNALTQLEALHAQSNAL